VYSFSRTQEGDALDNLLLSICSSVKLHCHSLSTKREASLGVSTRKFVPMRDEGVHHRRIYKLLTPGPPPPPPPPSSSTHSGSRVVGMWRKAGRAGQGRVSGNGVSRRVETCPRAWIALMQQV